MAIVNVILSGGVGSRLWPLSRKSRPKQYLPIFNGNTLFQHTVKRNTGFCDQVMVVGNCENYELSRNDLSSSGIVKYTEIIEACPRNTAAAIAFAAFSLKSDDILFVTPSDHLIESGHEYQIAVNRAAQLAQEGYIVTFGLKPNRAETGYGYIESDGEEVKGFLEKPNLASAEAYVKSGDFYWNSGMFCFRAGIYLEELRRFEPEVYEASKFAIDKAKDGKLDFELSMRIPSISVDYAVMEKTKRIKVVPSKFAWSDMGSFESIYDHFVMEGYAVDSNGNMVIGSSLHTEFVGLSNTILIQTGDAVLVLNKENAQDVKKVFEQLEREKPGLV
ncbi:mannose-1-phosphate guanylyltransferase [Algoriphagus chordae]|uniref:Mannose-1-phosphate guanylyltransferase n=1 Tax=Algoriphagus chordae TaxID=237019 RepID=A0A2W7QHH4_9BACT|nr:sugar phosphate nucleotidyltransferase [Algoriphagus chordae]PZX47703.1 mannose-1-phosphate guanylyltransferase [Algoriphagus chordae]PZX54212.1 mannose-1-phosphate guanylyltransferase [Algoriphagus chordae]